MKFKDEPERVTYDVTCLENDRFSGTDPWKECVEYVPCVTAPSPPPQGMFEVASSGRKLGAICKNEGLAFGQCQAIDYTKGQLIGNEQEFSLQITAGERLSHLSIVLHFSSEVISLRVSMLILHAS